MTQVARAKPGRPPKLSQQDVINAALKILEEQGEAGLSARKLCVRLGITPPTLYKYFDSIEGILAAIAEQLCAQIPLLDPASDIPLRDQVMDYLMAVYRAQITHPKALQQPIGSPAWIILMRHGNAIARVLEQKGCSPMHTVVAMRALYDLAGSRAALAREYQDADYAALLHKGLSQLPAQDRDALDSLFPAKGISIEQVTRQMLDVALDRLLPELEQSA